MSARWDHPDPFTIRVTATPADVDSYGHVNNVVYIRWLEQCAWAHSAAVGLPEARCLEMQRGMAVRTLHVDYLAACFAGDEIVVGNWICASDGRLRVSRCYQLVVPAREKTVLRAVVEFVCLNLATGRPVRLPPEFVDAYRVTVSG